MTSYPLRVTADQWQDIEEHYREDPDEGEESDDWTEMPVDAIPISEPDEHLEMAFEDRVSGDEPPF